MKDSARYRKIVEWSEEDQCFVGSAPDLMMGGCHGSDEQAVFDELCEIVDEWVEMYKKEGRPLPPASRPRKSRAPHSEGHLAMLREAIRGLEDVRNGRVANARDELKAFTDAQPMTDHKLVDRFKRRGRP